LRLPAHLDRLTTTANIEIARAQRTLNKVEQQERKLLDRYYAERVSQQLYDQEQESMTCERIAAKK
jgi:hypothetical protein